MTTPATPARKQATTPAPANREASNRSVSAKDFVRLKRSGQKIAMLTAYDFYTARFLDQAGMDGILVGDSANMVFYGEPTTLSITVDQMVYHTRAVARAVRRALVVADMPFMSYQVNPDEALRNAGRFLKESGAGAVKLEGGLPMVATVRRIIDVGIPVMGHIGLVPQSVHRFGGFAVQGRTPENRNFLKESAQALADAGCFSIVLEAIPADLAAEISAMIEIPTIGIGAGAGCDGQILVTNDLLGLYDEFQPRYVRRYANLSETMKEAFGRYADDVRNGRFPGADEEY
ncbi:MAG: 3-methyl-2-oxobutanoate hydroxymethyltransferase [Candidatus Zixiibacteriota bacterium]